MRRQRDLFGPAAGKGDAQIGGAMPVSGRAATGRLSAAESAHEDTAAENFLQRRQVRNEAALSVGGFRISYSLITARYLGKQGVSWPRREMQRRL